MDQSDLSGIEAAVMAKLNPSTPQPQRLPPEPSLSKKRRKKRRKTPQLPITQTVRSAIKDAAKAAEKRVLSLAIVQTQNAVETEEKASNSTNSPPVVKATGFCASVRPQNSSRDRRVDAKRPSSGSSKKRRTPGDAFQFVEEFRREVGQFGAQGLAKKDKQSYEMAQLIKLGCRPPKNEKIPIGMLIEDRKRKKIAEAKKKEMDIATGMLVRSKRK